MRQDDSEKSDSLIDKIVEGSQRSPLLQLLVATHPPLLVVQAGALAAYNWVRARRLYVLGDEIISLGLNPPEEQIKSIEFSEAFGAAATRVLDTQREEKIRLFARLFTSYVRQGVFTPEGFDVYEEDLNVLDELGYREYQLLVLLRAYEARHPLKDQESPVQRTSKYWTEFQLEATTKLSIPTNEFNAVLQRLTRTGLYEIISGTYWDYVGNRGVLSPRFEVFLGRIGLRDNEI
jgi:hypothetical protein